LTGAFVPPVFAFAKRRGRQTSPGILELWGIVYCVSFCPSGDFLVYSVCFSRSLGVGRKKIEVGSRTLIGVVSAPESTWSAKTSPTPASNREILVWTTVLRGSGHNQQENSSTSSVHGGRFGDVVLEPGWLRYCEGMAPWGGSRGLYTDHHVQPPSDWSEFRVHTRVNNCQRGDQNLIAT